MELVYATSLLLNLALVVFSINMTHDNTLFIEDVLQTKTCLQENITLDVMTPSVLACIWLCSTQMACQWVRYSEASQGCLGCNAISSTETENIIVVGAVYYEKATSKSASHQLQTITCPDGWLALGKSCYLIVEEQFPAANSAVHHCIDNFGHSVGAVELNTQEEHAQLIDALQNYTGNFWTSGHYAWDFTAKANGWQWFGSKEAFSLSEQLWAQDAIAEAAALAADYDKDKYTTGGPVCCMKHENEYMLSVCDDYEKLGVVCEAW